MKKRRILLIAAAVLLLVATQALALTEEEKAALIDPLAGGSGGAVTMGDPTAFVAPCFPLPSVTTPHDGNPGNDGGWLLVDFCTAGATGSGSASPPDCHHNDDDSAVYTLPFTFDFYGTPFTTVYINNNGNLSFGQLFSTFTATGFPVSGFPMVAPFWGDVDTGDQSDFTGPADDLLGHVWFKVVSGNTLAVLWDNVGYYDEHGDKVNTFQVVISDGTNPDMGLGNNVCFCYDDMQWTTGDASSGINGFGGVPATVGANKGDGSTFFQIGRFDHPGDDYDGPGGAADGVDYLDFRSVVGPREGFCLNASSGNVPPIPIDFPAAAVLAVAAGDVIDVDFSFIGPEGDQTVTVGVADPDGAQAAGLVIGNTAGNPADLSLDWATDSGDVGTYSLTFTALDDFDPPGETARTLRIVIEPVLLVELDSFTATPADGRVLLEWETALEVDNAGFYLLRQDVMTGDVVRLNAGLIPAEGDVFQGASYAFEDLGAVNGVESEYLLVDVELTGLETTHPGVRAVANPQDPPLRLVSPVYGAQIAPGIAPTFRWEADARRGLVLQISGDPVFLGETLDLRLRAAHSRGGELALNRRQARRVEDLAAHHGGVLYWRVAEPTVGSAVFTSDVFRLNYASVRPEADARPGRFVRDRRPGDETIPGPDKVSRIRHR